MLNAGRIFKRICHFQRECVSVFWFTEILPIPASQSLESFGLSAHPELFLGVGGNHADGF